jgi:hypothetical protein
MKHVKLLSAMAGAVIWGIFALFMNDMNSASDKDHVSGLVRLTLLAVVVSLWLGLWIGLTWFHRNEIRLESHLAIVVAALWGNSLLLEMVFPWLAFLAGWMWPSSLLSGLQVLLIGLAAIAHLRTCKPMTNNGTYLLVSAFSFLAGAIISAYVHMTQFVSIHDLPYQSQFFPSLF